MSGPRQRDDSSGFEDLADELEKWDETFDSLHDEPLTPAEREVLENETYPQLDEGRGRSKNTPTGHALEAPTPEPAPISPLTSPPLTLDADFGDDADDEVEISIVAEEPEDRPMRMLTSEPIGADLASGPDAPFEDDIDVVAEFEPVALGALFRDEAPVRRGPAIVRRDVLERRRLATAAEEAAGADAGADDDDDAIDEWERPSITNVMAKATVDKMVETAQSFFGDDEPQPVFELDGDFYDDIEIGADASPMDSPTAMVVPPKITARRTMAHVVRRESPPEAKPLKETRSERTLEALESDLGATDRVASAAALEAAHRAIDELEGVDGPELLPIEKRALRPLPSPLESSGSPAPSSAPHSTVEAPASPLDGLGFDLPPQLPNPRLVFAANSSIGSLALELPESAEPMNSETLDDFADWDQLKAAIALLPSGTTRGLINRWAASVARSLGHAEDADELAAAAHSDASDSGGSGGHERRRLADAADWQGLAAQYSRLESESGDVLAAELGVALGDGAGPSHGSSQGSDPGQLLRAATTHARAGDVVLLSETASALALVVADEELRGALVALNARITKGESVTQLRSSDCVRWELAAGEAAPERARVARELARAVAQRGDPGLADGYRIVAAGLAAESGDLEAVRGDLVAAAQRNGVHPAVCRPLLDILTGPSPDVSDYLIAVVSGTPAAPLAAYALWRWSMSAERPEAFELLRRAHALAKTDALILAELERTSEILLRDAASQGDSDSLTDAVLLAGPMAGGGLIDSLNRARAAHMAGDSEGRERALAGTALPTDRLLVVGERLAHIGRGAELGAPPHGIVHEFLWRHRAISSIGTRQPSAVSSDLTVAAENGDRMSARVRLVGTDRLEIAASEELWESSRGWSAIGGRVELVLARIGADVVADEPWQEKSAAAAQAMVEEFADPRVQWLVVAACARGGDWQRAANAVLPLPEGRYRAAHMLLERVGDPAEADAVLAELLSEHPEYEYVAELTRAARRRLGVLVPEATTMTEAAARSVSEPFANAIRAAEAVLSTGDFGAAIASYRRALVLHPGDPIAIAGIADACAGEGDATPIAEFALAELRSAEEAKDRPGRALAYETLARIDEEIGGDPESAAMSWESAADCDPTRVPALRALERAYLTDRRHRDLLVVFGRLLATTDDESDSAVLRFERARAASLCGRDAEEIAADYRAILDSDGTRRLPLFHIEQRARLEEPGDERARLEAEIAKVLGADARSAAAFLCRSGETLIGLGDYERAIERLQEAVAATPGHWPSLQGWREAAWRGEKWIEFAAACELASEVASTDDERARLHHLGGVALMDRALDGPAAIKALERALASGLPNGDAFARLRVLFDEIGEDERLGDLLRARLESEEEPAALLALRLELAGLCRNYWNDRVGAVKHLQAALEIEPWNPAAIRDLSDIAWELGAWDVAAESLHKRSKIETSQTALKHIFYRLGTIYADHLSDRSWALRCFKTALNHQEDDVPSLERLAGLGRIAGEPLTSLGALERLLRMELPVDDKVRHLHAVAEIQSDRGQASAAERAVRVAFDLAPGSRAALGVLMTFYSEAGDVSSIRVNLDRAAQVMRARVGSNMEDTEALSVIARVLAVRERSGVAGSLGVACVAAELARYLGDESPELGEIIEARGPSRPRLTALARAELDELLSPAEIPVALRHILRALRGRLGKHVGADPKRFGVGRSDRQKRGKHPVATLGAEMAAELGLKSVDIYLSSVGLGTAIAIPTEPISLVLGSRFASLDRAAELTFALGRGLKLGQMGLALVDTMSAEDLDLFVAGLIRQFAPEYRGNGQTPTALEAEQHRLRRLVGGSLANELRPHALALTGLEIEPGSLHQGARRLGLRAGLLASTSAAGAVAATLRLAGHSSIQEAQEDPDLKDLFAFALSEEHVLLRAAMVEKSSTSD